MHRIKSHAHRHAWKWSDGDPEYTRYVSFRSSQSSSRRPADLEQGQSKSSHLQSGETEDTTTTNENFTLSPAPTESEAPRPKPSANSNRISESKEIVEEDGEKSGEGASYFDRTNTFADEGVKPRKRDRLRAAFNKRSQSSMSRTSTSESKQKKHYGFLQQVKTVLFGSWINVLLICSPVGIALHVADVNNYAAFAVNFVAIIPLAGILSFATEEISLRVGETLGGLLNASFGNAVELIVSLIALFQDKIIIVQTSLIGSILSNLLLVLGMCFFFGGWNRLEQFFNTTVAQTAASLLALAVGSLLIPTCFHRFGTGGTLEEREAQIPKLSHGEAVILLLIYLAYLFFQLKSHSTLFNETGGAATKRQRRNSDPGAMAKAIGTVGANQSAHAGGSVNQQIFNPGGNDKQNQDEEEEEPQLSYIGAIITLCAATALVGVNSEFMVDGIGPISSIISPEFIGLILIPIVGNAAEHATAVTVAIKDKMDLAIGVAVGSSMQIALLILPLIVIIGWIAGKDDMTLEFDGFLLTIVFVAVLLVNYLISDGRSHWLEGVMLMLLYVIIAVAAYLYPADAALVEG